jgi:hypothetical protein
MQHLAIILVFATTGILEPVRAQKAGTRPQQPEQAQGSQPVLPHIGPRSSRKLGNSLMGPVVRAYARHQPKEPRVYLSEASAAMLWKHPLFSGTEHDRDATPTLQLAGFTVRYDKDKARMTATGKIRSNMQAHSVVISNETKLTKSDYWRKCYVARVGKDNSFRVQIDELDSASGFLRIVCCFENGAVIGRETGRGLSTGFLKQYEFQHVGYSFRDGWAHKALGLRKPRRGRKR